MVRQSPEHRNTDVEFVFGVLFMPIMLLLSVGMVYLPEGLRPQCWLNAMFGVACPACGGFRAVQCLCQGQFLAAFRHQPLVIPAALVAVSYFLYACAVVFWRLPAVRLHKVTRRDRWVLVLAGLLLVGIDWLYVLHRKP
jgi:hypothetical protein